MGNDETKRNKGERFSVVVIVIANNSPPYFIAHAFSGRPASIRLSDTDIHRERAIIYNTKKIFTGII